MIPIAPWIFALLRSAAGSLPRICIGEAFPCLFGADAKNPKLSLLLVTNAKLKKYVSYWRVTNAKLEAGRNTSSVSAGIPLGRRFVYRKHFDSQIIPPVFQLCKIISWRPKHIYDWRVQSKTICHDLQLVWLAMVLTRSVGTFIVIGSSGVAEALNRLLRCIPFVEDIIRRQQRDEISRLPEWILLSQIFLRLGTLRDLARSRCVCQQWNSLLSSLEFRHLWWQNCIDLEQWLISSDLEDHLETRWAAVKRLGCNPGIVPHPFFQSVRVSPTLEVASSHGLTCWVCHDKSSSLSIIVGNPRTRKWRMLPAPLLDDVPRHFSFADRFYSVRFIHHDLLQQKYTIFFLYFCPVTQLEVASLYDSQFAAWQRVRRQPMPLDRFYTGLRDASVRVIDMHYVHIVKGVVLDEVSIVAYDSYENSWDEIRVKLWHPFSGHGLNTAIPTGGICYTRLFGDANTIIHHVSLRAHAKDEYCRLLVVDGLTGRIGLWQLDDQSNAFQIISTIQQLRNWPTLQSWASHRPIDMDHLRSWSYVMRSDDRVFMAMFIYHVWSWLIVYDVGRSLWLIAHTYGDSSGLLCQLHSEGCRWPLFEYDVQWHDAHDSERRDSAIAIEDCCATTATIVAASGGRRLHLVRVLDIWSLP